MEDVIDATISDGVCEVVDIEVEVVSTMTALVVVAGAAAATGAVDSTTGEVELSTADTTTCCDQYMEKRLCDHCTYECRWLPLWGIVVVCRSILKTIFRQRTEPKRLLVKGRATQFSLRKCEQDD